MAHKLGLLYHDESLALDFLKFSSSKMSFSYIYNIDEAEWALRRFGAFSFKHCQILNRTALRVGDWRPDNECRQDCYEREFVSFRSLQEIPGSFLRQSFAL